jgi:hypothetical protein
MAMAKAKAARARHTLMISSGPQTQRPLTSQKNAISEVALVASQGILALQCPRGPQVHCQERRLKAKCLHEVGILKGYRSGTLIGCAGKI